MVNTTNLEKARVKLDKAMLNHEGDLTQVAAINHLEVIAVEFNLDEEKTNMLKSFKYQREVVYKENEIDLNQDKEEQTPLTDEDHVALLEERLKKLEGNYVNMVNLLSRIAVLTGNGNHLSEYGIERWMPGRKDMNKYG